jgi:hypothetical protein
LRTRKRVGWKAHYNQEQFKEGMKLESHRLQLPEPSKEEIYKFTMLELMTRRMEDGEKELRALNPLNDIK